MSRRLADRRAARRAAARAAGRSRHPRLRTLGAAALRHGHGTQPRRADGPRRARLPPRRRHGSPRRRVDPRDRRRSVGARGPLGPVVASRRVSSPAPTSGRPGSRAPRRSPWTRAAGTDPEWLDDELAKIDRFAAVRRGARGRGPPRRSPRGPTGSHGHPPSCSATSARRRRPGPRPRSTPTSRVLERLAALGALPSTHPRSIGRPSGSRWPSSSSSPSTTSAGSGSACCSPRSDRCAAPTSTRCSSSAPLRAGCPRHRATTRCSRSRAGRHRRARFRPVRSPPAASTRGLPRGARRRASGEVVPQLGACRSRRPARPAPVALGRRDGARLSGTSINARQLAEARPGLLPHVLVLESFAAALRLPRARDLGQRAGAQGPSTRPGSSPVRDLRSGRASPRRGEPPARAWLPCAGAPGRSPASPSSTASSGPARACSRAPTVHSPRHASRPGPSARSGTSSPTSCDLRRRDAPEAIDTIDPRERGSLVHKVLEDFVAEMPARTLAGTAVVGRGARHEPAR